MGQVSGLYFHHFLPAVHPVEHLSGKDGADLLAVTGGAAHELPAVESFPDC
jgi:hypothetical protein